MPPDLAALLVVMAVSLLLSHCVVWRQMAERRRARAEAAEDVRQAQAEAHDFAKYTAEVGAVSNQTAIAARAVTEARALFDQLQSADREAAATDQAKEQWVLHAAAYNGGFPLAVDWGAALRARAEERRHLITYEADWPADAPVPASPPEPPMSASHPRDGSHVFYVMQHRRTAQSAWLVPEGPLTPVASPEPWADSNQDVFDAPGRDHGVYGATGHQGWWKLGGALAALTAVRARDRRGDYDCVHHGTKEQAVRREFRLVRVTLILITEPVTEG